MTAALITGCSAQTEENASVPVEEKPIVYGGILAYIILPDNLIRLENGSDVIVRAKVLPDSETIFFVSEMYKTDDGRLATTYTYLEEGKDEIEPGMTDGVTRTRIKVLEVISSNAKDVRKGRVLEIIEPYYKIEREHDIYLSYYGIGAPLKVGAEYLFFLAFMSDIPDYPFGSNIYTFAGFEMGRYPMLEELSPSFVPKDRRVNVRTLDDFSNEELSLIPHSNATLYRKVFQEVINKYFK